jgi:hypothetical protein
LLLDTTSQNETEDAKKPKKQRLRSLITKTPLRRRIAGGVAIVFACGVLLTGWSLGRAITSPTNDPVSAKVAEWARDHGLGSVVTGLEAVQYWMNPPKIGGVPLIPSLKNQTGSATPQPSADVVLHDPITGTVTPALAGEGTFKSVVVSQNLPIVQLAYVRPDALHTSDLSAVVWMSGKRTRLEQHPGGLDPGHLSLWSNGSSVVNSAASGLIAAFNSGFKIKDARGGYYQDGHTVGVLRDGAASIVVYKDGNTAIGMWGRDLHMTSEVVSVRQNLQLLVDNHHLADNLDAAVQTNWGATLGGSTYVWRSGIGITATGDLVYVVGDALSAHTLATLLQHAGAIRAMQLDVNKAWISYMWYTPKADGTLAPHKALEFQRPANRYFSPTSRDFFAVYSR